MALPAVEMGTFRLVSDPPAVWLHYLRTHFVWDLLGTLPLDEILQVLLSTMSTP
jgi:hypothetical protein